MYCTNCGKEIKGGEKFCTACGTASDVAMVKTALAPAEVPTNPDTSKERKKFNVFAIVGFAVSIVCFLGGPKTIVLGPLAGLVFSIIALVQIKRKSQKGNGLAIAGVVLGGISTLVSAVTAIFTTLFSYAIPGVFRALLNYFFPQLFAMIGDQIGDSITNALSDFLSNAGTELLELLEQGFSSLF